MPNWEALTQYPNVYVSPEDADDFVFLVTFSESHRVWVPTILRYWSLPEDVIKRLIRRCGVTEGFLITSDLRLGLLPEDWYFTYQYENPERFKLIQNTISGTDDMPSRMFFQALHLLEEDAH